MSHQSTLEKVLIKVKIEEGGNGLPAYATLGASGADVKAAIPADIVLLPGQYQAIPTKLFLDIPEGYEVQVRPRSGLALKEGISILNTPGTVDHDYRGELKIILVNFSDKPFTITNGMRIAQLVVAPVLQALFEETDLISETQRGSNGFGSSGLN